MTKYRINYRLTVDNGKLVSEAQNFEFEIGDGQLAPTLEDCITNSATNDLQTLFLSGNDVFGEFDAANIVIMPKKEMPNSFEISSAIDFDLPNGDKVVGIVKEIKQASVVLDFNHSLSQCNIAFNFEILSKL